MAKFTRVPELADIKVESLGEVKDIRGKWMVLYLRDGQGAQLFMEQRQWFGEFLGEHLSANGKKFQTVVVEQRDFYKNVKASGIGLRMGGKALTASLAYAMLDGLVKLGLVDPTEASNHLKSKRSAAISNLIWPGVGLIAAGVLLWLGLGALSEWELPLSLLTKVVGEATVAQVVSVISVAMSAVWARYFYKQDYFWTAIIGALVLLGVGAAGLSGVPFVVDTLTQLETYGTAIQIAANFIAMVGVSVGYQNFPPFSEALSLGYWKVSVPTFSELGNYSAGVTSPTMPKVSAFGLASVGPASGSQLGVRLALSDKAGKPIEETKVEVLLKSGVFSKLDSPNQYDGWEFTIERSGSELTITPKTGDITKEGIEVLAGLCVATGLIEPKNKHAFVVGLLSLKLSGTSKEADINTNVVFSQSKSNSTKSLFPRLSKTEGKLRPEIRKHYFLQLMETQLNPKNTDQVLFLKIYSHLVEQRRVKKYSNSMK